MPSAFQTEPAPVTVAVPVEPKSWPRRAMLPFRTPPFEIVRKPLLLRPTFVEPALAIPPLITVGLSPVALTLTTSADVGSALRSQFPAVYQSADVVPVQSIAAASVESASPT